MKSTVDDSTVMSVHAQIKYKKSVWGVIKGFIEKNTWLGLEDFYEALSKSLMAEYCLPPAKAKSRRTRKSTSAPSPAIMSSTQPALPAMHHEIDDAQATTVRNATGHSNRQMIKAGEVNNKTGSSRQEKLSWVVIILLVALIAFNVILYVKLWRIDSNHDDGEHVSHKFEFLR
jgi:hypothetical protein